MTREASVRGLRCAEACYPPGLRIHEHLHERPSITVVAGGALVELGPRGKRETACERGVLLVRPAGEPHANNIGCAGVINLEIELEPALLADHGARITRAGSIRRASIAGLAARLRRELGDGEAWSTLLVEAIAFELIAVALMDAEATRAPAHLARAHDRIHAEFRDKLSIAALAREAGMHPVSFARAFRARYRASPGELVRTLRLAWAAQQLTEHDRSIAAIAADAGFCDQSHFARAFAAATGRTPREHRRARSASGRGRASRNT
jgi:AraC family transcriptional regulator